MKMTFKALKSPPAILLAVCAASLLLACLLSPPVMSAAAKSPGFLTLIGHRYSRIVLRMCEIFIVAGIFLTYKKTGISFPAHFFENNKKAAFKNIKTGLTFGVLSIAAVLAILLASNLTPYVAKNEGLLKTVSKAASITAGALCVAVLEESIFRAVFFRVFRSCMPFAKASFYAAAFFAVCHFFKSAPGTMETIGPASGFHVLADIIKNMFCPENIPLFAGLFLTGAVLNRIYENTGSITAPAALHACWVIGAKLLGRYAGTTNPVFVHKPLAANPVAWAGLIILLIIFSRTAPNKSNAYNTA